MPEQVLANEALALDIAVRPESLKIAESLPEMAEEQAVKGGLAVIKAEERGATASKAAKKLIEPIAPVSAREEAAAVVEDTVKAEVVRLDAEVEIVMTEAEKGEQIAGNHGPLPAGGMKAFKEYLVTDQIFPAGWTDTDRELVRLRITVGQEGVIKKIEVLKTPSKAFSDEAIRLVKEGPPWLAAIRDSVKVEESIKLRIVFSR